MRAQPIRGTPPTRVTVSVVLPAWLVRRLVRSMNSQLHFHSMSFRSYVMGCGYQLRDRKKRSRIAARRVDRLKMERKHHYSKS